MGCLSCCVAPPLEIEILKASRGFSLEKCGFDQFQFDVSDDAAAKNSVAGNPAMRPLQRGGLNSESGSVGSECAGPAGKAGEGQVSKVLKRYKRQINFAYARQSTTLTMSMRAEGPEDGGYVNTTDYTESQQLSLDCEITSTIDPELCAIVSTVSTANGSKTYAYRADTSVSSGEGEPSSSHHQCTINYSAGPTNCAWGTGVQGAEIEETESYDGGASTLIRTKTPHGILDGSEVTISGNSNPALNDTFTATVVDATSYTVPVPFTDEGEGGVAEGENECSVPGTTGWCHTAPSMPSTSTYKQTSTLSQTTHRQAPGTGSTYNFYSEDEAGHTSSCYADWQGYVQNEFGFRNEDEYKTTELIERTEAKMAAVEWTGIAVGIASSSSHPDGTKFTTSGPHRFQDGWAILIDGHSVRALNAAWGIVVLSDTEFAIGQPFVVGGTGGTASISSSAPPIAGYQMFENETYLEIAESRYRIRHHRTPTNYLKVWVWYAGNNTSGDTAFDVFGHTYEWTGPGNGFAVPRIISGSNDADSFALPHLGRWIVVAYIKKYSYLPSYEPKDGEPNGFPAQL